MKYQEPDKTKYKDYFTISINRVEALNILDLAGKHDLCLSRTTLSDLKSGLLPIYSYDIKCQECGSFFVHNRNDKLTENEVKSGGLCSFCDDADK